MTADLIAGRFEDAMAQWPTLDQMHGCLDCKHVFRVVDSGCPRCESKSVINLAALFSSGADNRQDSGDATAPINGESDKQEAGG